MATPHDHLFKSVFSAPEHARSALRTALPARLAALIQWETLALVSGEFIDRELAHLQSDLLFTALFARTKICFYLLFEHQSTVDRLMPLRLLRYMMRIWERFAKEHPGEPLPVILPVVLHHSDAGWTATTRFRDLLDLDDDAYEHLAPFVPDFAFVLDDLAKLDDDALRDRALTELSRLAFAMLMRCRSAADPVEVLRPWMQTMQAVLTAPHGVAALSAVARYIVEACEARPEDLRAFFAELGPHAEETFVTTAEMIAERALEQGRLEGKVEGEMALFLRLLERRFGALPAGAREKVSAATSSDLERWADRVLDATTLDDVFA
jgi:hypothetical protein